VGWEQAIPTEKMAVLSQNKKLSSRLSKGNCSAVQIRKEIEVAKS
jgi:hypothetical protein